MKKIICTLYKKLSDINARFCCLCYNNVNEHFACVQDFVVLSLNCDDDDTKESYREEEVGIHYILEQILGSKVAAYLSESDPICRKCMVSAINSYKFIKTCRENAETMAYSVEAFTTNIELREGINVQDYETMFIIMDFEESKHTQYYDPAKFADSNAALYKFQTLFRPYRTIIDKKGNTKYKCTKCRGAFCSHSSALKHFNLKHAKDQEVSLTDEIKNSSADDENNIGTDDIDDNSSPSDWAVCSNRDNVRRRNVTRKSVRNYKNENEDTVPTTFKSDYLTDFNYWRNNIKRLNELSHTIIEDSCGGTKYKCKECSYIFSHAYSARSHYLNIHVAETKLKEDSNGDDRTERKTKIINKATYTCVHCNENYECKYILIEHLLKEHALETSEMCNETKDIHLLGNDNIFDHIYTKVEDENGSEKFCCKMCLKLCENYRSVRNHFNTTHVNPQIEPYICSHCGKLLKTKHILRLHEERHIDAKVMCAICKKEFKNKHYFQDHRCYKVKSQSSNSSKDFKCDDCDKSYTTKQSLATHIRLIHDPNSVFRCLLCPKIFKSRSRLRHHRVTHTRERNFSCDICGDVFVAKNALVYHTRIHTGERPYECIQCGMKFLSSSRRADHVRRTHVTAMATCPICGVTLKHTCIRKHIRRQHGTANSKAPTKTELNVLRKRKEKFLVKEIVKAIEKVSDSNI